MVGCGSSGRGPSLGALGVLLWSSSILNSRRAAGLGLTCFSLHLLIWTVCAGVDQEGCG